MPQDLVECGQDERVARYPFARPGSVLLPTLSGALVGASAAALPLPVPGPVLAGLGITLGAGLGLKLGLSRRPSVQIRVDGREQEYRFLKQPPLGPQTAEQHRARLLARGELGDRIGSAEFPKLQPDPKDLDNLEAFRQQLKEWGGSNRLVADLGALSDYGRPALQLVNALQARDLLATGYPVYRVDGQPAQDTAHQYEVDTTTSDHRMVHISSHDYLERKFDYELAPLTRPESFDGAPVACGLPQGFMGVYADDSSCTSYILGKDRLQFEQSGTLSSGFSRELSFGLVEGGKGGLRPDSRIIETKDYEPGLAAFGGLIGAAVVTPLAQSSPLLWLGGLGLGALAGGALGRHMTLEDAAQSARLAEESERRVARMAELTGGNPQG
ncbi:MAG: hypothetical protein U0931_11900 [Vulcanimicrobiota bacterium]